MSSVRFKVWLAAALLATGVSANAGLHTERHQIHGTGGYCQKLEHEQQASEGTKPKEWILLIAGAIVVGLIALRRVDADDFTDD